MNIFKKLFGKREYMKLLFEYKLHRYDPWETDDSTGYYLYLEVYEIKLKNEKKPFYQIKLPDYTTNDYDLWKAVWDAVRYLDSSGPGYSRLMDEYRKASSYWRGRDTERAEEMCTFCKSVSDMVGKENTPCQNSQKSIPEENV